MYESLFVHDTTTKRGMAIARTCCAEEVLASLSASVHGDENVHLTCAEESEQDGMLLMWSVFAGPPSFGQTKESTSR